MAHATISERLRDRAAEGRALAASRPRATRRATAASRTRPTRRRRGSPRLRRNKKKKDEPKAEVRDRPRGLDQRIVALPDRSRELRRSSSGRGGRDLRPGPADRARRRGLHRLTAATSRSPLDVSRFDLKTRKAEKFLEKIDGGRQDGRDVPGLGRRQEGPLRQRTSKWFLHRRRRQAAEGRRRRLKTSTACDVFVDPRAEWRQMYHEVWRIERDFLYDPGCHGLDLAAAEKLYAPFLDGIAEPRRSERAVRGDARRTSCSGTSGRRAARARGRTA